MVYYCHRDDRMDQHAVSPVECTIVSPATDPNPDANTSALFVVSLILMILVIAYFTLKKVTQYSHT